MNEVGQSEHGIHKIAEGNDRKLKMIIDGVTYLVSSHFSESSTMNVVDKVGRLIDKAAETA